MEAAEEDLHGAGKNWRRRETVAVTSRTGVFCLAAVPAAREDIGVQKPIATLICQRLIEVYFNGSKYLTGFGTRLIFGPFPTILLKS